MDYYKDKLEILLKGLLILILLVTSADAATWTVAPSSGPGIDYNRIQDAINAAASGDTIRVSSGTYYENVDVNKRLTLQGVNSGSGLPVVDASKVGSAITLSANNCTLQNFIARNSSFGNFGIKVASSYNTISGNTATGNSAEGIYIIKSSGNTISGNTATNNNAGIFLHYSNGNTISGNTATNNNDYGIFLYNSSGNIISGNTATNNDFGIYLNLISNNNTFSGNNATGNSNSGIYLSVSSNNAISGNTATGNFNSGIHLHSSSGNTISSNTATDNGIGIVLGSSSSNTISGNTATGNRIGIVFDSSSGNTISDNSATSNSYGIYFDSFSNNNTISGNTVTGNFEDGIYIAKSSGNTVSGNTVSGSGKFGIYLTSSSSNKVSGNTVTGASQHGIYLTSSGNNNISGNTLAGNNCGIYLTLSSNNNISANIATGNTNGIQLIISSNNISANTATGNTNYGIYLDYSSGNTIYLNTFSNAHNAWSNEANYWNATTSQNYGHSGRTLTGLLGNIWSDYDGIDCDSDGIGDVPYLIAGGSDRDYHPIGGLEPGPVIEVEKTADRSEVQIGETINYTIWVNNTGNVNLTGVRAEDNLTGKVWDVGTLLSGQNYTNTTRYRVLSSDLPGPLANELWANGTDPCGGEVNASAMETVNLLHPEIDVNKTALPSTSSKGSRVNFSIDVTNTGKMMLDPVRLIDLLPEGLIYRQVGSANPPDEAIFNANNTTTLIWECIGPLNPYGADPFSATLRFNAVIDGSIEGEMTNRVTAIGSPDYGSDVAANATASVVAEKADIAVTKIPDQELGLRGELINFTLTVTNSGSALLPHVFVSDKLPFGLRYNSSNGGISSGQYVNWTDVGPLAAGESRNIWIKAEIDGSVYGNLTNRVEAIAYPEYGDPVNSSATADVESRNICISGHKYQHNSTGQPLEGWTIIVSNETGSWTNITNSDGYWQVCGLDGGNYTVCEVNHPGWRQVYPEGCYEIIDLAAIIHNTGPITGLDFYNDPDVPQCNLTLTKTADKETAKRGEDVTYNITLSNPCADQGYCFTNVTL